MIIDKHDIQSTTDVEELVRQFYGKVRQDVMLGPVFNVVAQVDWAHHIPRLVGFWSTVLLGSEEYKGNPVLPHLALGHKTPIGPVHFKQWLALFIQTVDELFVGERAEQAKIRAQSIAIVLQTKLHAAGLLDHT
jgi:hemoglobin